MKEARLLLVGGCIDWVPRLYLTLKCQGIRAQRSGVTVLRGDDGLTCWVLPNVDSERRAGGFSFCRWKFYGDVLLSPRKKKVWRGSKLINRFGLERPHMTSVFRALFSHLGLWWYMITKAPDATYIWKTALWALCGQLRKNILLKNPFWILKIYVWMYL